MKKVTGYLLIVSGTVLMIIFGYASWGLLTSHPLLRWSIFGESVIFTVAMFVLGFLALGAGFFLSKKRKAGKPTPPDKKN